MIWEVWADHTPHTHPTQPMPDPDPTSDSEHRDAWEVGLRVITTALLGLDYKVEPTPSPFDVASLAHDPAALVREHIFDRVAWTPTLSGG